MSHINNDTHRTIQVRLGNVVHVLGREFAAAASKRARICEGCAAEPGDDLCVQLPHCAARHRGDGRNVVFVEVTKVLEAGAK